MRGKYISYIAKPPRKIAYQTIDFLNDLQKEISNLLGRHVSQDELSVNFLNKAKSQVRRLVEKAKNNRALLLDENLINDWISALMSKNYYVHSIKKIFNAYKQNKIYGEEHRVLQSHPDLKLDYFKDIDSLEKAYWFGFLLAEGHIFITRQGYYGLVVSQHVQDGVLIKNFINAIGFNPRMVKYIKKEIIDKDTGERRLVPIFEVRFKDAQFVKNLISHGYPVGKKSGKIRFPVLTNPEYELACLLGFFDGD